MIVNPIVPWQWKKIKRIERENRTREECVTDIICISEK